MPAWLRRRGWMIAALVAGLALVYRQVFQGRVYYGRDAMRFFIPDSSFLLECLQRGEVALWMPFVRLGQPFAATLQSQVFYPPRLLTILLFGPTVGFTVQQVLHSVIGALCTAWAARRLGTSRLAAALAGGVFGLSPMLVDLAGQRNIVDAACWGGLVIGAAELVARRATLRRVLLLALAVAICFAAGSPEMLLWQTVIAAAIVLTRWRRLPGIVTGYLWGAALMALVLAPAAEFAAHSTRSGRHQEFLEWSASGAQLLGVFWPFADHPRGAYWGGPDEWYVLTVFVGSSVALLALGAWKSRRARPLWLALVLLAALSLGSHFAPAAWVLGVPPFSFFRYPGKYLVGVAFALSLLGALGLDAWAARARRMVTSPRKAALAAVAAMVALAAGIPLLRLAGARAGAPGGWVWLCAVALLFGVLFFALPRPGVRAGLAVITALELAAFHLLHLKSGWATPAELNASSTMADAIGPHYPGRISVGDLGRHDPILAPTGGPPTHLISRAGLVGNRFIEERLHAVEGLWGPELQRVEEFHLSGTRAVFDLVGTGFYVREGPPPFDDLQPVVTVGPRTLYRSGTALGRAFVVHRAEAVSDERALQAVLDPLQPARKTVYLADPDESPLPASTGCATSRAEVTDETSNAVEVFVSACEDGYLVLSDSWYPDWRVQVDGRPAKLHRADYALRAVRVGKGTHEVRFEYAPRSYRYGVLVSALAWLLWAFALYRQRATAAQTATAA